MIFIFDFKLNSPCQENSFRPMIPWRAKIITPTRMMAKITMRIPGIPGISSGPSDRGSSTIRRNSLPKTMMTEAMTEPVVLPNPPTTTIINRLKVRKNVKRTGEIVVIK